VGALITDMTERNVPVSAVIGKIVETDVAGRIEVS